jgi:hypothetical protein
MQEQLSQALGTSLALPNIFRQSKQLVGTPMHAVIFTHLAVSSMSWSQVSHHFLVKLQSQLHTNMSQRHFL